MVLRCFRNLVLFSWLSNEGGDGDSAIFVLQMRRGGKEELQVDFFQVISLKYVGHRLYCPQTFVFLFKHISMKHSCSWHIFSCDSLFMTLIFSYLPNYCFSSFSYSVTYSQIFLQPLGYYRVTAQKAEEKSVWSCCRPWLQPWRMPPCSPMQHYIPHMWNFSKSSCHFRWGSHSNGCRQCQAGWTFPNQYFLFWCKEYQLKWSIKADWQEVTPAKKNIFPISDNFRIIESYNVWGWIGPLRSLDPTVNPALSSLPLNHPQVPHPQFLKYLQGCWFHHFPGLSFWPSCRWASYLSTSSQRGHPWLVRTAGKWWKVTWWALTLSP